MLTLIIGCGNLLRSDDGVGPLLVRRLWELGPPPGVRLADGGTAGMDVAFQIGDAQELILVDACRTGAEPGTIFEVPGEEVETPPLTAINLHDFRWDHAIAFGRWMLKDRFPKKVTVFLVEAETLDPGFGLSPPVEAAMERLAAELMRRFGGETREG
ncbi:MAG: hydrogenase maturation protease [Alicyclobacillaceae bacterium]|nr:hydrogenase maturation protease [Alicyclobacillaceae bacterium]